MRLDADSGIDFPSPAEFNRLGVCEARKLPVLAVLILGSFLFLEEAATPVVLPSETRFLSGRDSLAEDDVVGRELIAGGCGKAPILMVLRTALAEGMPDAFPAAEPALTVGISGVECVGCGVGRAEGLEGAFSLVGVTGKLFRGGLGCGIGGRAAVGGSAVCRGRTGRDMARCELKMSIAFSDTAPSSANVPLPPS